MKILALSQVYWPDTASVSQHLTDLLEAFASKGHTVTVIASKSNYENPKIRYKAKEIHNNVLIKRLPNTSFGKKRIFGRLLDFLTFNILTAFILLFANKKKYDVIIGLTSPPLLSYIGIKVALIKKIKFVYWTMDLQPELSIISGYLKPGSKAAESLQRRGDFVFKKSDLIITLDKYMTNHIIGRIGKRENIFSIPVWPVMNEIYGGERLTNSFRKENNFGNCIVVMYSGNHAVVHPLDTLLKVETRLKNDKRFLFVHIGSGVRLKEVIDNKKKYELNNVIILPYQPREKIHLSLGSSDIQVVILGENCVGYTHPNKIYGAMYIGKPVLYIGPKPSHVSDVIEEINGNIMVNHGEVEHLLTKLDEFAKLSLTQREKIGLSNSHIANKNFLPLVLINKMVDLIETKI